MENNSNIHDKWTNILLYTHTMEYYLSIKGNKLLIQEMNHESIMLRLYDLDRKYSPKICVLRAGSSM